MDLTAGGLDREQTVCFEHRRGDQCIHQRRIDRRSTSFAFFHIELKDSKLEEVEELELIAAVSGHLTPEEMLGYAESSNTTALITCAVSALAFAVPGVIVLVKAFKGGQPATKGKKCA